MSASTVLAVGAAAAQPFPFNQACVSNGRWHLNSTDVATNENIFVATGGKAFQAGGRHRLLFPVVMIVLDAAPGARRRRADRAGARLSTTSASSLTTCRNQAKWKAAGVPAAPASNGRLDQAYVNPDGLRIEILLENKNQ